jgi:hypothetical protein
MLNILALTSLEFSFPLSVLSLFKLIERFQIEDHRGPNLGPLCWPVQHRSEE